MIQNTFKILKGIGEKKEQKFWQNGISNWDEFIECEKIPRMSDKTKTTHDLDLKKAKNHLDKGDSRYFAKTLKSQDHWRLYHDFEKICYLDIETTGFSFDKSDITVIGVYDGKDVKTFINGINLEEKTLKEELLKYDILVTFYGSGFDTPFIKRKFPTIEFDIPHIDLCFAGRRIGLKGGLKNIERVLGINRDEDVVGIDGYEAVRLWKRWKKKEDKEALNTLVKYNKEDIENLKPLAQIIFKKLKKATFNNGHSFEY